jgi:RNA polymerase sigma-70 factor (ECF subfamily)
VAGRSDIFKALKPVLAGGQTTVSYEEIAGQLGMKEGAVKTAVHRLRRRFAALLRTEIAETVTDPSEVEEEVQELFRSLQ